MKRITSVDNPKYKALLKLAQDARARKRQSQALLDGIHLVAACRDHYGRPELVAVSDSGLENSEIQELLESLQPIETWVLSNGLFKRLSTVETPTGILALIPKPKPAARSTQNETCVLLENIQDAGNLGSILRSAGAADVHDILLSKNSVDAWSPRVLRAAMGAHFILNIHEGSDLVKVAREFKGKVIAASQKASRSLFDTDLQGAIVFAFGNEGGGLSKELASMAHLSIAIPMAKGIESLNVAASVAVCLFEWWRQNNMS